MSLIPPIHLVNFFITSSSFEANGEYKPDLPIGLDLNVESALKQDEEHPERWYVSLSVESKKADDPKSTPYTCRVTVFGMFFCAPDESHTVEERLKMKRMIYVNGSSILYSSVRDHIRTFTGTGPYRGLILPTHRFNPKDILE